MSTTFYPDSIVNYVEKLKNSNIDFDIALLKTELPNDNSKIKISSYTEVCLGRNYQKNKYYVTWEDIRLAREEIKWISKYAYSIIMPDSNSI